MQRIRRLSLAITALLLVAFTSGCLMPRKPPPPPFRVEPYGAGFERGTNGKLVTVADDEGTTIGRMRVTRNSLRMQSAEAVPMGRVRVHASDDAQVGSWEFIGRDAALRCVREDASTEDAPNAFAIRCDEDQRWDIRLTQAGVHIQATAESAAEGAPTHIPAADEHASLEANGIQWSQHSLGVLRHAFDEGEAHAPAYFGVLTLAAWELREWQPNDATPTHDAQAGDQTGDETSDAASEANGDAASEASDAASEAPSDEALDAPADAADSAPDAAGEAAATEENIPR